MKKSGLEKEYYSLMGEITLQSFKPVKDRNSLFKDKYQTEQQSIRDRHITRLLKEYVDRFSNNNKEIKTDRTILKWFSLVSLGFIILTILAVVLYSVLSRSISTWEYLTGLIASLITLCASLFGIINYIAARAFPVDDEKFITEIVKLIQENDLKHKQENIKAVKSVVDEENEKNKSE